MFTACLPSVKVQIPCIILTSKTSLANSTLCFVISYLACPTHLKTNGSYWILVTQKEKKPVSAKSSFTATCKISNFVCFLLVLTELASATKMLLAGKPMCFFADPAFVVLASTSGAIYSVPPSKSIYLSCLNRKIKGFDALRYFARSHPLSSWYRARKTFSTGTTNRV